MSEITDKTVPNIPGHITGKINWVFWAAITIIVIAILLYAWLFA